MKELLDRLDATITGLAVSASENSEDHAKEMLFQLAQLKYGAEHWGKTNPEGLVRLVSTVAQTLIEKTIENTHFCAASIDHDAGALSTICGQLTKAQEKKTETSVHSLTDAGIREAVWDMTNGHCAYCGSPLTKFKQDGSSYNFCIEHVVPRSAGGPDNIANYVPSCLGCNSSKGSNHVLEFIQGNLRNRLRLVELSKRLPDESAA